ncbi:MAG: hypothetical protein J5726_11300 [Treponema sp.]|nr:hypothetical protein [Treponema sp.]
MKKYKQKLDSFFEKITENKIIRIRLDELNFHPELEKAFKIDDEVKERIKDDIKTNGNNTKAHPIHIFRMNGKWYVSDGHTRVTVLRELGGFTYVWAQVHVFSSISEALCHTMASQFTRRNEKDADLLSRYLLLREQTKNGKKLTADELASKLNKSRRGIFKLQEVVSKATKSQIESIKAGASINSIYQEIKKQEAEEAGEVATEEQPSTSTPTTPKASKPAKSPYQDGYFAGIRYAIDSIASGKTPADLLAELDA